MKRYLLYCVAVLMLSAIIGAGAANTAPRTVQGIPYVPRDNSGIELMSDDWGDFPVPDDMAAPDGDFTFDMITNWTGEGENEAALVIQWNDDREKNALVFGYRWDGMATGADMIRAVVANNPRLYGLIQYTNVSSPTDPNGGYTINGFGWDLDDDGDIALIDTKDNQIYTTEDGLFIHPRGYVPGQGGSSDYDYDDWKATDTGDLWGAGWYISYWSYWVKDDYSSKFGYSGWGASGRVLQNGSWDGWNFSLNMTPRDWKEFVAAPATIPEGAKTEFEYQGICYTLKDYSKKTVKLVAAREGVAPYSGDITIPATFVDEGITYSVIEVDPSAFEGTAVTTLALPATVNKIGAKAFKDSSLASLSITGKTDFNSIASIGAEAFSGCTDFTTIVLPAGMTSIPEAMFKGTAITEVLIPENIESISASAFEGCAKLTNLLIPSKVKEIGAKAFYGCTALKTIKYESTAPVAVSDDTFSAETYSTAKLTVPYGYENIFTTTDGWKNFSAMDGDVIPVNDNDIFKMDGVTYKVISAANKTVAVTYCKVDGTVNNNTIAAANNIGYTGAITIPAKVSYMKGDYTVTGMEDNAFRGAKSLTSVNIEAAISAISAYAFYDCDALTVVKLPATVTEIKTYAFSYSGILKMELPSSVKTLGERCFFQATKMESINVPTSITAIPNNCFAYCKALKTIELGDQITTHGSTVFQNCTSLTSVKLPANITSIPASFFSSCSALESVEIPEGVTSIGSSAFSGCTKLVIDIPASVKTLGTGAFQNCKAITQLNIPAAITAIPNSLADGCTALTTVTTGADIKSIGSYAFRNCSALTGFNIGDKVTSIGSYAFSKCAKITEINLPDGITSIGSYAFEGTGLTKVVIPKGVTFLSTYTFQNCTALTSVTLHDGITTIAGFAFKGSGLKEIVLPAKARLSGNDTFGNCTGIKVYSTASNPQTCSTYGLRISGSVYAPLIVPTGAVNNFNTKTGWKNASAITSPELKGIKISDVTINDSISQDSTRNIIARAAAKKMIVTGNYEVVYDLENLPEAFVHANDAVILPLYTAKININGEMYDAQINPADGTFSAEFTGEYPVETYMTITETATDSVYTTETAPVNLPGAITKINDTNINVRISMAPTSLAELVDYEPKDATITDMDLFLFDEKTLEAGEMVNLDSIYEFAPGYMAGDGKIEVLPSAESMMFEVRSHYYPEVKGLIYFDVNHYPVSKVYLDGINNDEDIVLTANDILALKPVVEPEQARNKAVKMTVENATADNMVNTYTVGGYERFTELVTYKSGEFDLKLTSGQNADVFTVYHVVVADPDNSVASDNYQDGTFWLNEDWFTHKNGSINYLTNSKLSSDEDIIYRAYGARNDGLGFGATSQYAMIFADKLFVMSKQENDKGDIRGEAGGRATVADARTLDRLASFDNIGGDGRACVGVAADKVYLGTNAGIRVLRFDEDNNFTLDNADIRGIGNSVDGGSSDIGNNQSLYNQQVGDMVLGGSYVYAIQQGIGVHIIDTETDELLTTIEDKNVQAITVDCNGKVWYATLTDAAQGTSILNQIDPATNEIVRTESVPGKISCSWGSWRSSNFFASREKPTLFWLSAGNSMMESGSTIYKWDTYQTASSIEPFYTIPALEGVYPNTKRITYASMRYDDRTNEILFATTTAPSGNYRWNWYNFLDMNSRQLRSVALKPYYWFPAMPVFPDKYAPQFKGLSSFTLEYDPENDSEFDQKILLDGLVSDADNIDANIHVSAETDAALSAVCDITAKGLELTFKAKGQGNGSLTLLAESNGRVSSINIPVVVKSNTSGISDAEMAAGSITVSDYKAHLYGLDGHEFVVYSLDGRAVSAFRAEGEECHVALMLPAGTYVLSSVDGSRSMKFILR